MSEPINFGTGWDATTSTPLEDFRKAVERIKKETGYQPPPPLTHYVSSDRYAWLLEQGYINADGTLTPLGNKSIMAASVKAMKDAEVADDATIVEGDS